MPWIPHPFIDTLLHLHGEGPGLPVDHGVSQLAETERQLKHEALSGCVAWSLLPAAHQVILILPLHLRQIHAAVVGLPALLAVTVLHEQTKLPMKMKQKSGWQIYVFIHYVNKTTHQHQRKYATVVLQRKLASLRPACCY